MRVEIPTEADRHWTLYSPRCRREVSDSATGGMSPSKAPKSREASGDRVLAKNLVLDLVDDRQRRYRPTFMNRSQNDGT
jgi:hypothetical protein